MVVEVPRLQVEEEVVNGVAVVRGGGDPNVDSEAPEVIFDVRGLVVGVVRSSRDLLRQVPYALRQRLRELKVWSNGV